MGGAVLCLLGDGMGEPGLDIPLPFLVVFFGGIIALITGISRWRGASRLKAICIPCVPLGLWLVCTFPIPLAGQGGAVPMWFITVPAFGIALVSSVVTAALINDRQK